MKCLILTADDFGLAPAINEAVERACVHGVLTSASLMVGAPCCEDAVERARRLPGLRVGLHLVLADGRASLPPEQIPSLVDEQGRFPLAMVAAGVRFFLSPSVRGQLEAEIRAQFEAYAATGLPLDHVDVHKHFHLHPTVSALTIRIGRDYGMRAVRLPYEPATKPTGSNGRDSAGSRHSHRGLLPWTRLLRNRLDRAGIRHNDRVFGLAASGQMTESRILAMLETLPDGVTEIYFHPGVGTAGVIAPSMAGYRHEQEFQALVSPRVREALQKYGIRRCGYGDLGDERSPVHDGAGTGRRTVS